MEVDVNTDGVKRNGNLQLSQDGKYQKIYLEMNFSASPEMLLVFPLAPHRKWRVVKESLFGNEFFRVTRNARSLPLCPSPKMARGEGEKC